ncbi:hypothetical protein Tco_0852343, partial [Tanacetum coccineum]
MQGTLDIKQKTILNGDGVDWTGHAEDEQENFALMAYSHSVSDIEVEAQLAAHQKNQLWYEENIRFMKINLDDKTDVLTYHKKLLAASKKEKEELKTKLENFQSSSKNLNKLLNSQMSAKDKFGLGYGDQIHEGVLSYENEVLNSVFDSRSSDVEDSPVNDRFANVEGMSASRRPLERAIPRSQQPFPPSMKSDSDDNCDSTFKKEQEKPVVCFVNTVQHVKTPRETVKEQNIYSPSPKLKERLFSHLIRDLIFKRKRMAKQVELEQKDGAVGGKRETVVKPSAGCNWRPKRHYWKKFSDIQLGDSKFLNVVGISVVDLCSPKARLDGGGPFVYVGSGGVALAFVTNDAKYCIVIIWSPMNSEADGSPQDRIAERVQHGNNKRADKAKLYHGIRNANNTIIEIHIEPQEPDDDPWEMYSQRRRNIDKGYKQRQLKIVLSQVEKARSIRNGQLIHKLDLLRKNIKSMERELEKISSFRKKADKCAYKHGAQQNEAKSSYTEYQSLMTHVKELARRGDIDELIKVCHMQLFEETKMDCISLMDVKSSWGNSNFDGSLPVTHLGFLRKWLPRNVKILLVEVNALQLPGSKRASLGFFIYSCYGDGTAIAIIMGNFNEFGHGMKDLNDLISIDKDLERGNVSDDILLNRMDLNRRLQDIKLLEKRFSVGRFLSGVFVEGLGVLIRVDELEQGRSRDEIRRAVLEIKKKQAMFFKVDFAKAYDSVRWDYLLDILHAFGFGPNWCRWIRGSLFSMASILVNGRPTSGVPFLLWVENKAAIGGCAVLKHSFSLSWCDGWGVYVSEVGLGWLGEQTPSPVPKGVLKTMESIRSKFFNGVDSSDRKISWVAWDNVLASKLNGGLGVSSFFALNRALLLKWVWRFISGDGSLWCKVIQAIMVKFLILHVTDQPSIWCSILREVKSLKDSGFDFSSHFSRLFALELDKEIVVANKMGASSVSASFRRDIGGLGFVGEMGEYKVKSSETLLMTLFSPSSDVATRWVNFIPIKVNVFFLACCRDSMFSFDYDVARVVLRKICRWWDLDGSKICSFSDWDAWRFTSLTRCSCMIINKDQLLKKQWYCYRVNMLILEAICHRLNVNDIMSGFWINMMMFRTSRFCVKGIELIVKSVNRNAYIM